MWDANFAGATTSCGIVILGHPVTDVLSSVCVCVQYDHHQIVFWLVVLTSFNHLEHMSSIEFVNGMELSHILWNIKAMFET